MRTFAALVLAAGMALTPTIVLAQTVKSELGSHPRLEAAIHNLEDAIAYMEQAPNNFGGHKGAALNASRAAIAELRAALAFRARQDGRY